MNKKQLIDALNKEWPMTKAKCEKFLNTLISTIEEELADGNDVRLVGFGSFTVKEQAARKGVNPRTKEPMTIPAKKVPKFRPGKELKERVNK